MSKCQQSSLQLLRSGVSARFFDCILNNVKSLQTFRKYANDATIELGDVFKFERLEKCPSTKVTLTKEQATKLFTDMMRIRRMEHIANIMYKAKFIRGFCHLYTGQEATAAGINAALREKDSVITGYRCHGWCLLRGLSVLQILAELGGREAGCQRGKGGSMHMYHTNFYGGNGIVGAQMPMGAGIGLASLYRGDKSVSVSLCGDGAANQGQLAEAYNIACLKKLPVIFVIENNGYGMGTAMHRSSCSVEYYKRGFPLPGIYVDGMDVLAVRSAAEFSVEFVLNEGPIVIESHSYRFFGHSMSDPGMSYRSREEVQTMRQTRDPITKFKQICIEHGLLSEDEQKKIVEDVRKEMDAAAAEAKNSKEVEAKELWADVTSENYETRIRGTTGTKHQHFRVGKLIPRKKISIETIPVQKADVAAPKKADEATPKKADEATSKKDDKAAPKKDDKAAPKKDESKEAAPPNEGDDK